VCPHFSASLISSLLVWMAVDPSTVFYSEGLRGFASDLLWSDMNLTNELIFLSLINFINFLTISTFLRPIYSPLFPLHVAPSSTLIVFFRACYFQFLLFSSHLRKVQHFLLVSFPLFQVLRSRQK
jgi:hypothetical protein